MLKNLPSISKENYVGLISQEKLEANKRVKEELEDLSRNPLANFDTVVSLFNEDILYELEASMIGPEDSSYKKGLFFLKIIFPDDYPKSRPEIIFLTQIYHLNVKFFVGGKLPLGYISLTIIYNWESSYSMRNATGPSRRRSR